MTVANCDPSCSSATRWLVGVLALKNASQFLVIAAVPVLMLELAEAAGDEDIGADDVAGGDDEPDVLGLLLPQAATVAVSAARPSAPASCAKWR